MIRSVEYLVAAVVIASGVSMATARADITRCESSGRCPAPVAVPPSPEGATLRWLRDNDDDGIVTPSRDHDADRRADQDR